jgi:hypothetical protein
MATIRREIEVVASADQAWDAVRDYGALHTRLVPGFVTNTRLEGDDRLVTFFNGSTVRERLVTRDDAARRLAWSIVDGPYTHHNGAMEVVAEAGGCRLVWTTDLLPDEAAERTAMMMERGLQTAQETLDARV